MFPKLVISVLFLEEGIRKLNEDCLESNHQQAEGYKTFGQFHNSRDISPTRLQDHVEKIQLPCTPRDSLMSFDNDKVYDGDDDARRPIKPSVKTRLMQYEYILPHMSPQSNKRLIAFQKSLTDNSKQFDATCEMEMLSYASNIRVLPENQSHHHHYMTSS